MVQEVLLVNPRRKKRKSSKRRRRNAWYGHSRAHARAARKGWRTRRRNPVYVRKKDFVSYAKDSFSAENIIGGGAGLVAALAVPKWIPKWSTGWKSVAVSAATAVGGGFLIHKYVDKNYGKAFTAGGVAVTAVKALRLILSGKHTILGGYSQEEVIGQYDDEELLEEELFAGLDDLGNIGPVGQDEEEIEEDIFGLGTGELVPTYEGL